LNVQAASSWIARLAALAGILLLGGAVAAAYYGMRGVKETLRVERLALHQSAGIAGLQASLKEVEALKHEFLITGEAGLVARVETLREKIRQHLSDLVASFELPEQRAALPALSAAIAERLAAIDRAIQERRQGGAEAAARLAFTPAQAAIAERSELLLEDIRKRGLRIVAQRELAATEDLGFLERAMLVGILAAGVLLAWAASAGFRQEAARRAAESALQARPRDAAAADRRGAGQHRLRRRRAARAAA
jgi:CHASE3 domain sensor protein